MAARNVGSTHVHAYTANLISLGSSIHGARPQRANPKSKDSPSVRAERFDNTVRAHSEIVFR
jgi:hypothetical protein